MPESVAELLTLCLIKLDQLGETLAAAHVNTAIQTLKDQGLLDPAASADPQTD